MPDIPEDWSQYFEDRTAASGSTPYPYSTILPPIAKTPRDKQAPGLWVQGGSPATPRDLQREQMEAALNAMGTSAPGAPPILGTPLPGGVTPRPTPPIWQGTLNPKGSPIPPEWYPQAAEFWSRGYGGDVPMLGPTAGVQLGPPPTPMPNLRLTPVTGDPFAIPGT